MFSENILSQKRDELKNILLRLERVSVAYSGGIDSTLLLATCLDVLGINNVKAVYVSSCLQTKEHDNEIISFLSDQFKTTQFLKILNYSPLNNESFVKNDSSRCYICKKSIYKMIKKDTSPFSNHLLDGTNKDDLSADRPGLQAIKELGVICPLAKAGFTKHNVRQLAKETGLINWDLPSNSCLATRITTNNEITLERLHVIEYTENILKNKDILGARVCLRDNIVSVKVDRKYFRKNKPFSLPKDCIDFLKESKFETINIEQKS